MTRRTDQADLVNAAARAALAGGLSELTFGRLAKRTGVSDRMLVYYFGNRAQLVECVVDVMATQFIETLDAAFGARPLPVSDLLRRAWPIIITSDELTRVFAVWFELAGRAAAGKEPELRLAKSLAARLIEWCEGKVEATSAAERRSQGALLATIIDGGLLLHHLGQSERAQAAIGALIRSGAPRPKPS